MHINNISQQSFGVSYSEIMIKTAQIAKVQKHTIQQSKPNLYTQFLLKDKFFNSKDISENIKSNYFSYLINCVKP